MKTGTPAQDHQKRFDFSVVQPRPFLAKLPARIDTYEEGVAQFFQSRTGLNYYQAIDQVVDWVISTGRVKVVDLLTDTAVFALQLAGRKAFHGRVYSFDSNITLLELAKQRAAYLDLQQSIEFRSFQETRYPVPDGYGDLAVSIFDLHRHPAEQYLAETLRILVPNGYLIMAEMLEPKSSRFSWSTMWRRMPLQFAKRSPVEACAIYYDREEIVQLLFKVGFRQVIMRDLNSPEKSRSGVFSLIAATK